MQIIQFKQLLQSKANIFLGFAVLVGGAGLTFLANSTVSPPSIPAVNLATDPLYAIPASDKPTIALALSVEFPTVGAQYVNVPNTNTDDSYSNAKEYLGYYDAESCYSYNNDPKEIPAGSEIKADYKRFDRLGPAVSRMCTDAFSGNFLNWASNSAIDMLRLALSGGDRYLDKESLTVLQRAVLPTNDSQCSWGSNNFPMKRLKKDGGGANKYWGAVPTSMITAAATSDIWIGNTRNQIHFGTANSGNCGNTSDHALASTPQSIAKLKDSTALPTTGMTKCADEGGACSFTGSKELWYGFDNKWIVYQVVSRSGTACNNATLTDPIVGKGKSCYIKDGPAGSGLNDEGFFYARTSVCTSTDGTLTDVRDYGFCKQYPSGKYKPTGVIQKYSDSLRLAAFGYALENKTSRVGGVLRAPMKYVGYRTFSETGVENTPTTGNPNMEWDSTTGVFRTNPDGDTEFNTSGVINYLNKFGRTGTSSMYKRYDPVGELHYETLRYLQGLPPTELAVKDLTTEMKDGFPIYTTWDDPYGGSRSASSDYSCTKANIVVIGDVNSHDQNRMPTADKTKNILDIAAWRTVVQNFEKNLPTKYIDGQGVERTIVNPNGANNDVPSGTGTSQIMGSAYWARTHDIRGTDWTETSGLAKQRPGLRVRTFAFDVNEYGRMGGTGDDTKEQNDNRRLKNQLFMAAKYGGFETDPSNKSKNPYNTWGNPFKQQDGTSNNDVWQDTARPAGEANSYYLQSSARGILSAFDEIFNEATTQARSIAGAALQSKNLTSTGTAFYQAAFDTSDWSGDVISTPLTVDKDNQVVVGRTDNWSAATRLSAVANPNATRNIFVGSSSLNPTAMATVFKWDEIEESLKGHLNKTSPTASKDTLGPDRLSYLRGSNAMEKSTFRKRDGKILGDIVNSGVVYSGSPSTNIGNDASYGKFTTANASRTAAVFVGANDGMLHAFSAATGDELFAYIPSWMGPKLSALTRPDYLDNHQSYVDATPVVGEVKVAATGEASDWKTVLVGGTGGGGRGVYALDVTDPASFGTGKVLWEFTQKHDPAMGYVIGAPKLVKMKTSASSVKTPTYRWFAAVASGVNNYLNDGEGNFSDTGAPTIFLLALDKPAGTAWTASGSEPNYYKISLPVKSDIAKDKPTGIVNFQTIIGSSGEVTQLYAGDLHGNLWKLDFSMLGSTDWNINKLSSFKTVSMTSVAPYPLYIAKNASGAIQPITAAPALSVGPSGSTVPDIVVSFGTGKFMEAGDKSSTAPQSFYSILDNNTSTPDSTSSPIEAAISGRGRLVQGTLTADLVDPTIGTVSVSPFKWGRPTKDSDMLTRAGYFFDFASKGERAISNPKIFGNTLTFNTLTPASAGSTGGCTAEGGSGRTYDLDLDSGNGGYRTSTVGLLGESLLVQIPGATTYTKSRTTGRRTKTEYTGRVDTGSGAPSAGKRMSKTTIAGRLSWRQVNNYLERKNAK